MSADRSVDAPDGPIAGQSVQHGTGVTATRAFPTDRFPGHLDPFVLFERFYIDPESGFPTHPHRGFEIVSYMLEGGMDHEDSLGVSHTADAGDAMHITTGSGIEHSEMPADGAACNGLQLWVNLPPEKKDADADYADASADELPTEAHEGATVTTVVGEGSPLSTHTSMEYLDVRVDGEWTWTIPEDWSGFLFGVAGEGTVDGDAFGEGDVLPSSGAGVSSDAGESSDAGDVTVESDGGVRLVAVSGEPHGQPIQQRGPYVF